MISKMVKKLGLIKSIPEKVECLGKKFGKPLIFNMILVGGLEPLPTKETDFVIILRKLSPTSSLAIP